MREATILECYHNENFAKEVFKSFRFKEGIVCKKCNSKEHYWLKSKDQFQCKHCRFRTTLKSGTILEGSKLPVSYLLITLHLLQEIGDNVTPDELQKFTNHKYYDPLWIYLRKIKSEIKKDSNNSLIMEINNLVNTLVDQQNAF